ncbi:uncharacterized protein LOC122317489 isoform X2 [Carya illinoinensis]|uniref:uncharacterized protein LOC122317489 isoform X2 n=1 Tax=Carya illinoinensis TaxID=32201 RepID=UPI001C719CA9|nr:uncharacterized protein LOC122317489 isoform X2 [Carya illinoinensis]
MHQRIALLKILLAIEQRRPPPRLEMSSRSRRSPSLVAVLNWLSRPSSFATERGRDRTNHRRHISLLEERPPMAISGRDLHCSCVGRLEVVRPKPVGFLCGSTPVPTDNSFHSFNSSSLVPSRQLTAPRYRMLPTETDPNTPPLLSKFPDKVLPIAGVQPKATGGHTICICFCTCICS